MSFINPEFIYFMLPPLVGMGYFVLRKRTLRGTGFDMKILEKLVISGDALGRRGRHALFFMAFFLMIVALARPVSEPKERTLGDASSQIMVLLDISRSMKVQDVYPDRLSFAKNRLATWMQEMKGTEIGIMAFAKDAFLVSPLSLDTASLRFLLQGVDSDMVSRQGTNIANVLTQSQRLFRKNDAKELLVISDGGEKEEIDKAIDVAKEQGLIVHVMVVGTAQGGAIPEKEGLVKDAKGNIVISRREDGLRRLSEASGGVFIQEFGQGSGMHLLQNALKRQDKEGKVRRVMTYTEWFYLPLGAGIMCVLLSFVALPKRKSIVLLTLLFSSLHVKLEAGLLDFWYLNDANSAVEKKAYKEAANAFAKVPEKAEAKYNEGNMHYLQGEYEKALAAYKHVKSDETDLTFQTLHNMGNALAHTQKIPEAIKSYEEALKLKEDADTRFNLELLKKQQEEQKNKSQDPQQNKDENKESTNQQDQKQNQQQQDSKADTKEAKNEANENDKNPSKKESEAKQQPEKRAIMSEEEAQKWEQKLLEGHPKTQPMQLGHEKSEGDKDAITW